MGGSSIEHHLHPGHHVATRSGIKLLADILKPRLPYRGPQLCHGLPRSTLFNQLHIAMAAIDADIAQLRHDPGPLKRGRHPDGIPYRSGELQESHGLRSGLKKVLWICRAHCSSFVSPISSKAPVAASKRA